METNKNNINSLFLLLSLLPTFTKRLLGLSIIIFSLQNCTAWPALTAILALAGGDGGGGALLLPPGGGGGGGGDENSNAGDTGSLNNNPVSNEADPITPASISFPDISSQSIEVGNLINPTIQPTTTGTVTNCTSSPPLPDGITINPTTCEISGTPTTATPFTSYTITVTADEGTTTGTLSFAVIDPNLPPQNLNFASFPTAFVQNVPIPSPITPSVDGDVTGCAFHPSTPAPAGITIDPLTCAISGTPTVSAVSTTYNIVPSNANGSGPAASIIFAIEPFPAVISVTSPNPNGAYSSGTNISIQVVFNKIVIVTGGGTPQLALNTDSPATTFIDYVSGSGTDTLLFQYNVVAGNNSNDLSYVNASSLNLNGAFIRDIRGNNSNLLLPIPGQPNSLSANKNLVIDTVEPVISSIAPASNAIVNNTAVSYTLSETCASGSTTWTRVGGSVDPSSPHIANWVGSELNSGTRTNAILANNPTLVDNAIYDITFQCLDPAGNSAISLVSTSVTFTEGPLQVVSAETLDTNNNGQIDTYRLSFNKPVNDSTFPGYVANAQGSVTNQWLVAGYTNVRMIHGTAVTFVTDSPNDAIIYLRFNESPLECSSNTTVGCDTNSKPDLTTTASPGLQDLATNSLTPLSTISVVEADGARPILVGARSLGATLVDAFFSETVNLTDSEALPNYAIIPGITVTLAQRDLTNTNIVHLTTSSQTGGENYTLTAESTIRDLANLNLNTQTNPNTSLPGNIAAFTGLVKPVVASITTISATTLRITYNEPILASTAECATQSSCGTIYQNLSLPVLSSVSESGAGNNSASFILTVNPMIEGQAYTTTVLENTAQSVASSERMGNTNNSATFNGDGKPNANISPDTATACPLENTASGVQRRVVVQYDQDVLTDASANAANNPANYSISGCLTGDCDNGAPPSNSSANQVTGLGANKYAIDFPDPFDSDASLYQIRISNVRDLTGNTIPTPGTFSFQCGTDTTPPSLISVTVVSATNTATVLLLNFTESVDNVTANVSTNYKYDANAFGAGVDSAARQANLSQVRLIFAPGLSNGGHQLRVQNVQDLAGNVILDNGVNNTQPFILNAPTGFSGGSVFDDPFDDGTPAANIVIYDGKLYIGADQTGSKLFESNFSLTTAQTITLDADGNLFNGTDASFNGYLSEWSGCGGTTPCGTRQPISGVDTIYAGCVGGASTPKMTGNECVAAGGTEYMFVGALNTMGNYKSFWHTTRKSSESTTFPFTEEWSGDAGGGAAYRSMNLLLFKDQIFVNFGAELGGGGRGGRICMNPAGCDGGAAYLSKVGFTQISRVRRIGASNSNTLRNGAYNNVPVYGQGDGNTEVLNAINVMYEHDNDGTGGNESQLYMANGGWYLNNLPTSSPWERTGSSDGGVVRTVLARSTKSSLPQECSTNGCGNSWEDVTPDSKEKWSRFLSIPYPQNSAVTGSANCATSLIEMDCTEPYNLFVPALKAIPYMRTAPNGDLYMIRNACSTKNLCRNGAPGTLTCDFRTEKQVCPKGSEIPQLWRMSRNCGTAANCSTNGWELVAENASTGRTDMANTNNSHVTLLEIVGSYLYIGFDNPINGANIWRVDMSAIPTGSVLSQSDFTQVHVNGIGSDSGGSNQKLFSHAVVNDAGKNWLIITTRDGLGAARIYRTANDED